MLRQPHTGVEPATIAYLTYEGIGLVGSGIDTFSGKWKKVERAQKNLMVAEQTALDAAKVKEQAIDQKILTAESKLAAAGHGPVTSQAVMAGVPVWAVVLGVGALGVLALRRAR